MSWIVQQLPTILSLIGSLCFAVAMLIILTRSL